MKPRISPGRVLLALGILAVVIQAVPYGHTHANPKVVAEPAWSSVETRELVRRACFDCHSNETHWPWYSHVAPVSWLVQRDVEEGREALNVSEWTRAFDEADESAEVVRSREMPPRPYVWLHPQARLERAEQEALAAGLERTFGGEREARRGGHDERRNREREDGEDED